MKSKALKKSMFDILYVVVILFVIIVALFFVHKIWNEMRPELQQEDFLNDPEAEAAFAQTTNTLNGFNVLFVVIMILALLAIIILAFMLPTNGGTFFMVIFMLLIIIVVAVMLSNTFTEISSADDLANETATYSAPVHVLSNFPKYALMGGLLLLIIMFGRYKGVIGGGEPV